jgi:hypothetical protein
MPFRWFRKSEQAISNCKRDTRRNEIDMIRLLAPRHPPLARRSCSCGWRAIPP